VLGDGGCASWCGVQVGVVHLGWSSKGAQVRVFKVGCSCLGVQVGCAGRVL
jgi:hypothetical protein